MKLEREIILSIDPKYRDLVGRQKLAGCRKLNMITRRNSTKIFKITKLYFYQETSDISFWNPGGIHRPFEVLSSAYNFIIIY